MFRFGVFFRFDPRQEVQVKLPVAAGGFISSLAKLTTRLASDRSFTFTKNSCSSYEQAYRVIPDAWHQGLLGST